MIIIDYNLIFEMIFFQEMREKLSQFSLSFTLTLWNPTIHPVTIHPRVPVTREYVIRDPIGNLVSAEVHSQQCMTKLFFLSYSIFPFQTQRKMFLVERVRLRISIYFKHHCQRLVTVPIILKQEVSMIV